MAFFKRELSPIERFESALRDKQAVRQKMAERLSTAETLLVEKRTAAERLAVAGASNAQLDRAEAKLRTVEERAKTLRAELAEFDEQIVSTERALADAKAQRGRDMAADEIEGLAAAIEQAAPGFGAGAAALVDAVTKSTASVPEATRFSASAPTGRRRGNGAASLSVEQRQVAAEQVVGGRIRLGGVEQPQHRVAAACRRHQRRPA